MLVNRTSAPWWWRKLICLHPGFIYGCFTVHLLAWHTWMHCRYNCDVQHQGTILWNNLLAAVWKDRESDINLSSIPVMNNSALKMSTINKKNNNNENYDNGIQSHGDLTAESMYAGLVSIFLVAVVLFLGITITMAGGTKWCQKWCCHCCRKRRRANGINDEGQGQACDNQAFVDPPPSYDEVMRRDSEYPSTGCSHQQQIYTIPDASPFPSDNTYTIGSNVQTGSGRPLCRSNTQTEDGGLVESRGSLSEILGNPPNYLEVLRNWASNEAHVTGTGVPSKEVHQTRDIPPPKYSDVEKQLEEEQGTTAW